MPMGSGQSVSESAEKFLRGLLSFWRMGCNWRQLSELEEKESK